jgi:formate/nitrite transporter
MQENLYTPKEILQKYIKLCMNKVSYPVWKVLLMGVVAGAFISIGAAASSVSMHGIESTGVARTIGGAVFPIGLMLIVLIGGELFTGNCLVIFGILDKKYPWPTMAKNLTLVFVSNLAGAVLMAVLVAHSGQFEFSHGALGAYVIKVALTKSTLNPVTAFISGILCNIVVCAAVFMAAGAKDLAGKIWAIFFPIFVFVICGFEHCVANMYYISAGIFALANKNYVAKAMELYGYTEAQLSALNWGNMFVVNLLPVTIGNIVGGSLFFAVPIYFAYREKVHNEQEESDKALISLKEAEHEFSA